MLGLQFPNWTGWVVLWQGHLQDISSAKGRFGNPLKKPSPLPGGAGFYGCAKKVCWKAIQNFSFAMANIWLKFGQPMFRRGKYSTLDPISSVYCALLKIGPEPAFGWAQRTAFTGFGVKKMGIELQGRTGGVPHRWKGPARTVEVEEKGSAIRASVK